MCAYGDVDELNAVLGVVLASAHLSVETRAQLTEIQHLLFRVGGDLATPLEKELKQKRVSPGHVQQVEEWIRSIEERLPPQRAFILPGGTAAAAHLHHARTVCRRAERSVVALQKTEPINSEVAVLLNRLSDYLFLAARAANHTAGAGDVEVQY